MPALVDLDDRPILKAFVITLQIAFFVGAAAYPILRHFKIIKNEPKVSSPSNELKARHEALKGEKERVNFEMDRQRRLAVSQDGGAALVHGSKEYEEHIEGLLDKEIEHKEITAEDRAGLDAIIIEDEITTEDRESLNAIILDTKEN